MNEIALFKIKQKCTWCYLYQGENGTLTIISVKSTRNNKNDWKTQKKQKMWIKKKVAFEPVRWTGRERENWLFFPEFRSHVLWYISPKTNTQTSIKFHYSITGCILIVFQVINFNRIIFEQFNFVHFRISDFFCLFNFYILIFCVHLKFNRSCILQLMNIYLFCFIHVPDIVIWKTFDAVENAV